MEQGISFKEYPFKFIWLPVDSLPSPAQVVVAVPKRRIALASHRNTIKRRIRESYRRHKGSLNAYLQQQEAYLTLMILFTGPADATYATIDAAMQKALNRLPQEYEKLENAG